MQNFIKASRNLKSKDLPISNTAIVMGPSKSGKSYFIKKSLNTFYRTAPANSRLIIHIDLSGYGILNFESFRNRFETAIIDQILDGVQESQSSVYIAAMKDTLSLKYDKSMLDILIQLSLARIVNDLSHFEVSIPCREQLCELYYLHFDGQDVPEDSFELISKISEILSKDLNCRFLECLLLFIRELCFDKDITENHRSDSLSSSGIDFTDTFFDMLNHVSGYHSMNNFEDYQLSTDRFVDVVMSIGIV